MNLKQRFQLSRFVRGEQPNENETIELTHRRIFILPTKWGLGFVLLIMALLLIAFVYNNNLAYMLAFLLISVFFVSMLHCYKSLAKLQIKQGQSHSVFASEAAQVDVIVNNPGENVRSDLRLKLESETRFSLASDEKMPVSLYTFCHHRGWHEIPTITLFSTYPLGLFRAWSPFRFKRKLLVYPKPVSIELAFPESESDQSSSKLGGFSKGNEDFYGLKEYQPGDSIKHIHWKTFAKGQGLFCKQYGGNAQTELWLNYEQTPGHNLEQRIAQLCRWVIDAEKAGLRYGFKIPGVSLEPAHGQQHYQKCLEALALF